MTQTENPFAAGGAVPPKRTSQLAIWSLVCGILGCCPFITSLLALILGVAGFIAGRDERVGGRGLAVTGIVLGIIGLVGWSVFSVTGLPWLIEKAKFPMEVPPAVMKMGANGDTAGFRAGFWGTGASATDEEITAFFAELESRYGAFDTCDFNPQAQTQQTFGQPIVAFPYRMTFRNETVDAEIDVVFSDPQKGGIVFKLGTITVLDATRGDVVFPPDTSAGGP